MTEKITGLRFEINVGEEVDSSQFLNHLINKMNEDLPKFKIQKIALESNWQSTSTFVCLVHSKKVQTLNPVFEMEFAGFKLLSTKNTKTVKFERALGKHTVVYIWNEEYKEFRRREDFADSKPLPNIQESRKKQKTSSSDLRDLEKKHSPFLQEDQIQEEKLLLMKKEGLNN